MKTFTLRLSDIEADILDRLSIVYGKSKNSVITSILAKEYSSIDPGTRIIGGEALWISDDTTFGCDVFEYLYPEDKNISERDFLICKRALEFSAEKCTDEDKSALDKTNECLDVLTTDLIENTIV
jgi:hypothetical protein